MVTSRKIMHCDLNQTIQISNAKVINILEENYSGLFISERCNVPIVKDLGLIGQQTVLQVKNTGCM